MKFDNLKPILAYQQVPSDKSKYWTKSRCILLAKNFYILDEAPLRKLFGGRSMATLNKKASELRKRGWDFAR